MNELTNKRPNEQTNQRILSLTNEPRNNWLNKWMSEQVGNYIIMIKQIAERTTKYITNERMHEPWTHKPTNELYHEQTNKWTNF